MKNYYTVLGLSPSATQEQIKTIYRELAWSSHPDHGGSQDEFAAVAHAYRVLSDKDARLQHDRELALLCRACEACGGMGQIRRQRSFNDTVMLPCQACHGAGFYERS